MEFKNLKSGFMVYLLDKTDMSFSTEKVVDVSLPHIDAKITSTNMVVDVTTDKTTYCMMADAEIAYPANKVIATDKMNILREIEATMTMSEQALAQVPKHEETIVKCKKLKAELDPAQKEKQAVEERFGKIEKSMEEITALLKKLTE